MKNLVREDCGVVKITAKNEFGETHKEIRLTVIDVPSEPLVLVASDTTMDSTTLSWSHPEKMNGAPLTGFIIERKAVDSNRWRLVGKTNASTLKFLATDLFSNQVYSFRIIAVNSAGEGPPSQTVDVPTTKDKERKLDLSESSLLPLLETPEIPDAKLEGNEITLSWNPVAEADSYIVERLSNNEGWLRIASIDKTNFLDRSLLENGTYRYRIKAEGNGEMLSLSDSTGPLTVHVGEKQKKGNEDAAAGNDVAELGRSADRELSPQLKSKKRQPGTNVKGQVDTTDIPHKEEERDEPPTSLPRRQSNAVDEIVNTKQRLKKRKPAEVERRASVTSNAEEFSPRPSSLQIKKKGEGKQDGEIAPVEGARTSELTESRATGLGIDAVSSAGQKTTEHAITGPSTAERTSGTTPEKAANGSFV
ncbi:unnamed protein product [Heligmosomoides polygyrus]|uniref:Fibronectin type-III domain-containing protein n=1 Tax=Heligmosomoides polygyrus TaxID=6339 RepID=A0A183FA69_HELPZ|nr:unnamed protein product [Heligmosomoides polygyrus]